MYMREMDELVSTVPVDDVQRSYKYASRLKCAADSTRSQVGPKQPRPIDRLHVWLSHRIELFHPRHRVIVAEYIAISTANQLNSPYIGKVSRLLSEQASD